MQTILLKIIRIYQNFFSLDTGVLKYPLLGILGSASKVCRHTPSCSEYTYQAINNYGALRGSIMGIKRIAACNPWRKQ